MSTAPARSQVRVNPRPLPTHVLARMSWHARARHARTVAAHPPPPPVRPPDPPLPPDARAALHAICGLLNDALTETARAGQARGVAARQMGRTP